jgi:hypothetical protein
VSGTWTYTQNQTSLCTYFRRGVASGIADTVIQAEFWGPCIVIYSYNRNQQDVLFLNIILINNSTCFGQTYCPSSGVLILYSQQMVFVFTLCKRGQFHLNLASRQSTWPVWPIPIAVSTVSRLLMMDMSETCRFVYQNEVEKQCTLLASMIRIQRNI